MHKKSHISSTVLWRGIYFCSVLLLNIMMARVLGASLSGWVFYFSNVYAFVLVVLSGSLESGLTYLEAQQKAKPGALSFLAIGWTLLATLMLIPFIFWSSAQGYDFIEANTTRYFALFYVTGILLTTYFAPLFYARNEYRIPNIWLSLNQVLLLLMLILVQLGWISKINTHTFLILYFISFLIQGMGLVYLYHRCYKIPFRWELPGSALVETLIRFSLTVWLGNIIFFLLYRIDYWFIQNICRSCTQADLGNYIQVSKFVHMFMVLPTVLASGLFPQTVQGNLADARALLLRLCRLLFLLYTLILLPLVLFGKWFFPTLFGPSFQTMYEPFVWLIPGIYALSLVALLNAYHSGKRKLMVNVIGSLLALLIIALGDVLLIPDGGIIAAAQVSSVGYTVYGIYTFWAFWRDYKISWTALWWPQKGDLHFVESLWKQVQNKIGFNRN